MKRLLPLAALILSGSVAFGQDPDLVEGARRAMAYWHSLFLQCGNNQGESGSWYAVNLNGSYRHFNSVSERLTYSVQDGRTIRARPAQRS